MTFRLNTLLGLLILLTPNTHAEPVTTDVCIYGGTSAGVVAAVEAARLGKTVALVEAGQHLGGMSSEGLGGTDIDNHAFQNSPAVGGLALEFYRRINAVYGRQDKFEEMVRTKSKQRLWSFEPHVAEAVFDAWVKEAGVQVFRGARLSGKEGVSKEGPRITALRTAAGGEFRAKVFIDATYEGDLLAAAGVSTTVGREGNAKYDETKSGIRTDTKHSQFDKRVDPYKVPGDRESGLIYGVQDGAVGEHGAGDESIQAFCFRLCLTKNPDHRIPITQPPGYDPAQYELQRRYLQAGGVITPPGASLPNGKTDPGSWHHLAGNLPGWNHLFPVADQKERERMLRESLEYTRGLYWFMAHDPAVPEKMREAWSEWGLCKDEFTDNGGWPRMFYVRNGRRMTSDFVMTEAHGRKVNPAPVTDPVAVVWWPFDLHNARRLVRDGAVWNEGAVFGGNDWIPFGVSYRSLVPKAGECVNLLTPTCPSSSYVAYGAFRLEWTFMATAQATAQAAVMAVEDKVSVQEVDYTRLRERLLKAGQVIAVPEGKPSN